MNWELVLGLELHLQPKLNSKMFCSCSADIFGKEPNTHTCPVCLGLPGALPAPNGQAIKLTQILGLALNCKLQTKSKFDRKNYFYPDLPKGYQISQYDEPLCIGGFLGLQDKKFRVRRVHLEEDTGKSIHEKGKTLLDFNKSGMALVEIVTEPDFTSAKEASDFAREVQRIARYLGVSDCDMEKGQFRLEANISVRKSGDTELPNYRVEVKNINSFRFFEKAVSYEFKRQSEMLEKGEKPVQENRGWDDVKGITRSQRSKEEEHDYRYFPEPDIPPFNFTQKYLDELKKEVGELPSDRLSRFMKAYGLSFEKAMLLCESKELSEKFESIAKQVDPKALANLLINKSELKKKSIEEIVKEVKLQTNKEYLPEKQLKIFVEEVIKENGKAFIDYKNGKNEALMFLTGMTMKKTSGKSDPSMVKKIIDQMI